MPGRVLAILAYDCILAWKGGKYAQTSFSESLFVLLRPTSERKIHTFSLNQNNMLTNYCVTAHAVFVPPEPLVRILKCDVLDPVPQLVLPAVKYYKRCCQCKFAQLLNELPGFYTTTFAC